MNTSGFCAGFISRPQDITQLPVIVSMYFDARVQSTMQLQALNGRYAIQAVRNVLELIVDGVRW